MTRSTRMLCLLHLPANALLLWLGYEWLGVGESSLPRLALSFADALIILTLACWLHGATYAYFRGANNSTVNDAFRTALRNIPALLAASVALVGLYCLLGWWESYSAIPAFQLASYLTLKFRKPVKPAAVLHVFNTGLWLVRWVLLPAALVPLFSGVSSRGWRGFGEFGWRRHSRLYRLEVPVLLVCALWVPFRLVGWVPRVNGFGMEMLSFVLRIAAAYLLFVTASLLLAFLTSAGRPAWSQPKTAASP